MNVSPQTTVREILRQRPRAVEVFESSTGAGFWKHLDSSLIELCESQALKIDPLLHRLETLPAGTPEAAFNRTPLYELVDHLADDHRRYRDRELPRIEKLLNETETQDFPDGFPLEELRARYHSFKIDFLLHMNEEEEYLFPKVLRTEGSFEHPGISPEIFTGSVNAYSAIMLQTPEAEIKSLIESLRDLASAEHAETSASNQLRSHLNDLCEDIVRHANLEAGVLLPRTLDLERILKYRAQASFSESEGF